MFKFSEGSKIDKISGVEAGDDVAAALYAPEAIIEDKKREEAMIDETLARSGREEQMEEKAEMDWSEKINESEKRAEEDDDPEKNKPGYELWGRFAQYKKPVRRARKKIKN